MCVALVQEGVHLRSAGITAPILVLSEQPPDQMDAVVTHGLTPTVASTSGVEAIAAAVARAGRGDAWPVQLKIDTGMNRAGADPADAVALADDIAARVELELQGVFTHLANADEPDHPANAVQLDRFAEVLDALDRSGHRPQLVHAANSAGALALPASRFDLVRMGIAAYGIEPGPGVRDLCADLLPVMSVRARVSRVHTVEAGAGVSYGFRHVASRRSTIATVPIGYADGVPRRLHATGGEVLVHGARLPIIGVVTMDQLMIDCGDEDVAVGDEVVLIGAQSGSAGSDAIRAEEWADRLDTIGYEIACGISPRVPRVVRRTPHR